MVASGAGARVEGLAQDLFKFFTQFCLVVPRRRRRSGDLKEAEFLTLAILHQHGTMIVGDIQRLLGVLPAQMSRISDSLESRERALISRRINPHDKRKIDVCLTAAGEKAFLEYQATRTRGIAEFLRGLPEDEQEEINRLMDKLHVVFDRGGEVVRS